LLDLLSYAKRSVNLGCVVAYPTVSDYLSLVFLCTSGSTLMYA
jgi:hypothetical protein